nr:hypothetical protein GCM10020092_073810 [Actinoplanes digitatis]
MDDDTAGSYSWHRVGDVLREEVGGAPYGDRLTALGARLFPGVLHDAGVAVTAAQRRWTVPLAGGGAAAMWNTPGSPLRYDGVAGELSAAAPLTEAAVLAKLSRVRPLQGQEPQAVRDLLAAPRLELARFGFLFPDLETAWEHLVAEPDEAERWRWFRHRFALFHARCRIIARHLAEHVLHLDGGDPDDAPDGGTGQGEATTLLAARLLRSLLADENFAAPPPWEQDDGHRPDVTWDGPARQRVRHADRPGRYRAARRAHGAVGQRSPCGARSRPAPRCTPRPATRGTRRCRPSSRPWTPPCPRRSSAGPGCATASASAPAAPRSSAGCRRSAASGPACCLSSRTATTRSGAATPSTAASTGGYG